MALELRKRFLYSAGAALACAALSTYTLPARAQNPVETIGAGSRLAEACRQTGTVGELATLIDEIGRTGKADELLAGWAALAQSNAVGAPGLQAIHDGELGLLVQLAITDPAARRHLLAVLRDAKPLKLTESVAQATAAERLAFGPLSITENMGTLSAFVVRDELGRNAQSLQQQVQESEDGAVAFDVAFIGAGYHSSAGAYYLRTLAPDVSIVAVEKSGLTNATFHAMGRSRLNTAVRGPERAGPVCCDRLNTNLYAGPMGPPDLTGELWSPGGVLQRTGDLALYASRSGLALFVDGRGITKGVPTSDGRYRFEIDGRTVTSKAKYRIAMGEKGIYANAIMAAGGVGDPILPKLDEASRDLILSRPDDFMLFEDFLNAWQEVPAFRDRFRAQSNGRIPRILVWGGGNSGEVSVEDLLGQGPHTLYQSGLRTDRWSRGEIGPITWVTGTTPLDHQPAPRYRALQEFFGDGSSQVRRQSGHVVGVVENPTGETRYLAQVELAPGDPLLEVPFDFGIPASGYTNDFKEKLLAFPSETEIERGMLDGAGEVGLGLRFTGEDVWLAGPTAGLNLVQKSELAGARVGLHSIAARLPRTLELVRAELPRFAGSVSGHHAVPPPSIIEVEAGTPSGPSKVGPFDTHHTLDLTGLESLFVRSQLAALLRRVRLPDATGTLEIDLQVIDEELWVRTGVRGADGTRAESLAQAPLAELIRERPALAEMIGTLIEGTPGATATVPLENGTPQISSIAWN